MPRGRFVSSPKFLTWVLKFNLHVGKAQWKILRHYVLYLLRHYRHMDVILSDWKNQSEKIAISNVSN